MFDKLKRKLAAGLVRSVLKSLAADRNTQTSITGLAAAMVLAVHGLDLEALIAGDPGQIAGVVSALLVGLIGIWATRSNADGKTTLVGAVAGALRASAGDVSAIAEGVTLFLVGYFTNKPAAQAPKP